MIGVLLTVPVACWRKGHAREFVETEELPPPATCYGALLSFVGEEDPDRHRGCACTAGLVSEPAISTVLRTFWRIKGRKNPQGVGDNVRPDLQQLVIGAEVLIWCDSSGEHGRPTLEERVRGGFHDPSAIRRSGGWSLGESTHLVNDAKLLDETAPVPAHRLFLTDPTGDVTLPVWVDHVGASGTRYAVGCLQACATRPDPARLPRIPVAERAGPVPPRATPRRR